MARMILACFLLGVFFLLEIFLRNKKSKKLKPEKTDQKSTSLIGICYFTSVSLLIILNLIQFGFFYSFICAFAGLIMMTLGLFIRIWSMHELGIYYSRTLRIEGNQQIVQTGPYRVIRHPGYLGSIMIWIGLGIAIENWILIFANVALFLTSYSYRISAEEKMLFSEFGEAYANYKTKTWRLLPFIY